MLSHYAHHHGKFTDDTKLDNGAMAHYVYDQVMSNMLESNDTLWNNYQSMDRYGRRILTITGDGFVELTTYASNTAAEVAFYDNAFPAIGDGVVSEGSGYRHEYYVTLDESEVGTYSDYDSALTALAQAMVDNGVFPPCWKTTDRGNYFPIDDEVRALHNEGGDGMKVSASRRPQ